MAAYKITFEPMHEVVEVRPDAPPDSGEGKPGSILDIAVANGVRIEHACGGVGVCGTCHVIIDAGMENLSPAGDEEIDAVEAVPDNRPNSRLACQAVVGGDVTVRIPDWNRNLVKEQE